jgi:hypothetical protein
MVRTEGATFWPRVMRPDAVLDAERLDQGRKRLHSLSVSAEALPDSAVVAAAREAWPASA